MVNLKEIKLNIKKGDCISLNHIDSDKEKNSINEFIKFQKIIFRINRFSFTSISDNSINFKDITLIENILLDSISFNMAISKENIFKKILKSESNPEFNAIIEKIGDLSRLPNDTNSDTLKLLAFAKAYIQDKHNILCSDLSAFKDKESYQLALNMMKRFSHDKVIYLKGGENIFNQLTTKSIIINGPSFELHCHQQESTPTKAEQSSRNILTFPVDTEKEIFKKVS